MSVQLARLKPGRSTQAMRTPVLWASLIFLPLKVVPHLDSSRQNGLCLRGPILPEVRHQDARDPRPGLGPEVPDGEQDEDCTAPNFTQ